MQTHAHPRTPLHTYAYPYISTPYPWKSWISIPTHARPCIPVHTVAYPCTPKHTHAHPGRVYLTNAYLRHPMIVFLRILLEVEIKVSSSGCWTCRSHRGVVYWSPPGIVETLNGPPYGPLWNSTNNTNSTSGTKRTIGGILHLAAKREESILKAFSIYFHLATSKVRRGNKQNTSLRSRSPSRRQCVNEICKLIV